MLRLATKNDSEWIAAIHPLWKPNSSSWVLDKKAFAIWQTASDEAELLYIAVEASERGKGLAKTLMERCHKELIAQGIKKFYLEVSETNISAVSLYKKLGYEKIAERKEYYKNGETAVVMKFSAFWDMGQAAC
ncbi:MAG: GNAT family N-acetyltransferase [Fibromonadaceae bacterium]|jgi:ribosomal protein S18 acetylase RimI-like enzyme|nr:GNAT family N-acetyltransferase [Fibromonadaceae bacterium]